MAGRRKIDKSGWEEEGRVQNIDTHVASEVKHDGPATYLAAYEDAKKVLEEENKKPEGERKTLDDIRMALRKTEPQAEPHNAERSKDFNDHVTIRNYVKSHLCETHNRAIEDALAGRPQNYQAYSIRYA